MGSSTKCINFTTVKLKNIETWMARAFLGNDL
jgi:hypothetical protein